MAYQHALPEAAPSQHLRGGQAAHAHEASFLVHQLRFAIQHVGQFASGEGMHHLLQGVVRMKTISGIEEADVVARSHADSLVHRVIQALVRFAHHAGYAVFIPLDDGKRVILRGAVHDDVFHMGVGLRYDTPDGFLQFRPAL